MARYYEETVLIEFVKKYTPHIDGETTMKCVERAIREAPTADVVPRAELDAMRGAANSYKMHYEKAKQEADRLAVELEAEKTLRVVRIERIFEEIEKCFREDLPYTTISEFWLTELKKKYLPGGEGDERQG